MFSLKTMMESEEFLLIINIRNPPYISIGNVGKNHEITKLKTVDTTESNPLDKYNVYLQENSP